MRTPSRSAKVIASKKVSMNFKEEQSHTFINSSSVNIREISRNAKSGTGAEIEEIDVITVEDEDDLVNSDTSVSLSKKLKITPKIFLKNINTSILSNIMPKIPRKNYILKTKGDDVPQNSEVITVEDEDDLVIPNNFLSKKLKMTPKIFLPNINTSSISRISLLTSREIYLLKTKGDEVPQNGEEAETIEITPGRETEEDEEFSSGYRDLLRKREELSSNLISLKRKNRQRRSFGLTL